MNITIPLFCWKIKIEKLRKKKTAWERCDTRGIKREYEQKRQKVIQQLKRELGA